MVERLPDYRSHLKPYSRVLRRLQTDVEKLFWSKIRRKQLAGHQFYRQRPLGKYIVDFYCPAKKLVIELDGGQHFERKGEAADRERDAYFVSLGLTVLRFSNREILQELERVLSAVYRFLTTENLP